MKPLHDWPLVSKGGRVGALIGSSGKGVWLLGGLIDHSQVILLFPGPMFPQCSYFTNSLLLFLHCQSSIHSRSKCVSLTVCVASRIPDEANPKDNPTEDETDGGMLH